MYDIQKTSTVFQLHEVETQCSWCSIWKFHPMGVSRPRGEERRGEKRRGEERRGEERRPAAEFSWDFSSMRRENSKRWKEAATGSSTS